MAGAPDAAASDAQEEAALLRELGESEERALNEQARAHAQQLEEIERMLEAHLEAERETQACEEIPHFWREPKIVRQFDLRQNLKEADQDPERTHIRF